MLQIYLDNAATTQIRKEVLDAMGIKHFEIDNYEADDIIGTVSKIAEDNGYDVLTIALFGDVEVLHERYLNRMANENRHPVHLSTTIDKFEDFKKCSDYMRRIEIPGEVMRINATDFGYQNNEEILAKIDAFMAI